MATESVLVKPASVWWRAPLCLALVGNLLLWGALPPLGWSLLAWLAPAPWVILIRQQKLTGKRPYSGLWLAGFVFWLATLYWLTLPHWATAFGWVGLSIYLACYFVAFIALSRVAVHTLHISPLLAAPAVWTGLELFRAYLLSGFAMASLSHTQYRWPEVIQISDVFGSYGVSFLIVLVGAAVARMVSCDGNRGAWWPLLPAAAAVCGALAYGYQQTSVEPGPAGPKVALIQGSIDIDMKYDPAEAGQIYRQYFNLSLQAVRENPDLELIVWPETMLRHPWVVFDENFVPPADAPWTPADVEARCRREIEQLVRALRTPCLLGIDTIIEKRERTEHYNSALLTDREGSVQSLYYKCHLVAFGEYVPLADTFPWLYRLTPLPGGLDRGSAPQSIGVGGARLAPDICYENTIPHLIRSQVIELRAQGQEPDVLVNLTNDGWFWGSSELDMHLACAVFRSVECRKPFLIAANTGFSAWIDSCGRLLAQGRRRATDLIIATPTIDRRGSWYLDHGDAAGGVCLAFTGGLAVVGLVGTLKRRKSKRAQAVNGQ